MKKSYSVKPLGDGQYAALSKQSPYFCFVAATRKEAEAIADRALEFCRSSNVVPRQGGR